MSTPRFLCWLFAILWSLPVAAQGKPTPFDKACDAWVKSFRAGQIDFMGSESREKQSPLAKEGLLKGTLGKVTARKEVEILLDAALAQNDAAAALRLVKLAALGLDQTAYPIKSAPHLVRALGEQALSKFTSNEAKDCLLRIVRERPAIDEGKDFATAMQAAALRALGGFGDATFRTTLEENLRSPDERMRLAAADGLGRMFNPASVEPLAQILTAESHERVIEAAVSALGVILDRNKDKVDAQAARAAHTAALAALAKGGWRTDLALVEFLGRFRSLDSVPALIGVLERFAANIEEVKAGKLSTLLRHRTHETLLALTGAFYPAEKPEEWRAFWEREKDKLTLAPPKEALGSQKSGTVSGGFFGIPVQGSRIVFIVDVSGSMVAPAKRKQPAPTGPGGKVDNDRIRTRMDAAKENLVTALEGLPEVARFSIISFSTGVMPWQKGELVQATPANKKRAIEHVKSLKAEGGTNIWGALAEGLKMKSLVYGARYESNLDELFFLSDGLPSVGDVIDPEEIKKLVSETNRFSKVRINTVYLGEIPNQLDRGQDGGPLMKDLAEQNGGKFVRD